MCFHDFVLQSFLLIRLILLGICYLQKHDMRPISLTFIAKCMCFNDVMMDVL